MTSKCENWTPTTAEYNPRSCPDIKRCEVQLTRHLFIAICNTPGFVRCHHYAR
ncbi:unnamed protein product, partial [marine sediment metagenome]